MTAHFEAKKHAYRQTQDGIVVSFVVHPNDVTAELATAPLGTRYMVAFAEIGDDDKPKQSEGGGPKSTAGKTPGERMVTRAVMLCKDAGFQRWAAIDEDVATEDMAADYVRRTCGVKSRSDIARDTTAQMRFMQMESQFHQWAGRSAEQRG